MAEKKVQIKNAAGDSIFPKTLASLVTTTDGGNLGTVEVGAQVNKIEKISINGKEISIVDKAVNIEASQSEYSVAKAATAESGYAASYYLTKDGTKVGEYINIPKDMVVESGSVKEVTVADSPVAGYKIGDKYIDLVLANADNSHIYVLVSDLIDVYTGGNGISVNGQTIAIDTSVVATQTDLSKKQDALSSDQLAAANSGITATKVAAYEAYATSKQDKLTDSQMNAVNSGVTSVKIATYDGYAATINAKANSSDVYTKTEVDGMNLLTYTELA
jgi:hypothetical protein